MSQNNLIKVKSTISELKLKLITELSDDKLYKLSDYIEYTCPCNNTHKKTIKEFFKKPLKSCCDERLKIEEYDNQPEEKFEENERWKKFERSWVSETGKVKNLYDKILTLDEKNRVCINKKHLYVSRIMAIAFKIDNYEKIIDSQTWIVSFKDKNNKNLKLANLFISTKSENNSLNGSKSRQSEEFKETISKPLFNYFNKPYKTVKELPNHVIFEDGSIYNSLQNTGGNRFITGSKTSEGYLYINTKGKSYKIHRLVCMAWHPIEGKELYEDYSKLQVNHLNGIKTDNHKDNLNWETQSENMKHAYDTKLNKKVRAVLQFENYDGKVGKLIGEYPSLAKASRETKIPEHEIRDISKGKVKNLKDKQYLWKYKNEEESEEYRQKFSSKLSDRN